MFRQDAGWQWESGFARLNQVELYEKREEAHILAEETEPFASIEAAKGTPFGSLKLPEQIWVRLNNGIWILADIDWEAESYRPDQTGDQTITGALGLPSSIENTKKLKAKILVKRKGKPEPTPVDPDPEKPGSKPADPGQGKPGQSEEKPNQPVKKPNSGSTKKAMAVGKVFKSGNFQYKVKKSSVKNGTVEVQKLFKKTKKITIPASVKKNGITYRVVSIRKKAFWKNKKVESVVIGKYITNIGEKSFYGCTKLKSIKFMGTKAPKIGKGAFSKIKSGYKIKVVKKMSAKQRKALNRAIKKSRAGSR